MIFSITAQAQAQNQIILIDKGTPAPFRGLLFPEDKALEFRKELLELDYLRAQIASYEREISFYKDNETLYQDKVNLLTLQNKNLLDEVNRVENKSTFNKVMWFVIGVAVTGAGVYVGSKVVK